MDTPLTNTEARLLGSLIEKEITTPDYYPLSLNALMNAANQKSNREPVMNLDEDFGKRRCGVWTRKALCAWRITGTAA